MIAYSVPAQVRPRYCPLCSLYGSCAKALPKRVHEGCTCQEADWISGRKQSGVLAKCFLPVF